MLAYRVFTYDPLAVLGQPGHPGYLRKPQGLGRLDNPDYYEVWYLATEMSGAIGEVFGDLPTWSNDMFYSPQTGLSRALGIFELSDDLPILELDDSRNLLDRGLRPTQVVERNRPSTQSWALSIWKERSRHMDGPLWAGVRWWSYYRPQWRVLGLWGQTPKIRDVQTLSVEHIAVRDAASHLRKVIHAD